MNARSRMFTMNTVTWTTSGYPRSVNAAGTGPT